MQEPARLNDLYLLVRTLLNRTKQGLPGDTRTELEYVISELERLPDLDPVEQRSVAVARSDVTPKGNEASAETACQIICRRLFGLA
jgi:hypothetical protein